jgi:hypothetical protein
VEAGAAPLVTGDLTIYYDFDSFTNTVMDGSGNGFNGKVQDATRNMLDNGNMLLTDGVISNDTTNPKRGAGAIRFSQTDQGEEPVFLDMDGSVIKATAPTKIPTAATTVAAWLNIPEIRTDLGNGNWNASGSILQATSAGPSFVTHFQLEGDGRIRLALRGELQAQNIVNSSGDPYSGHPYPNQPEIDATGAAPEPWPLNEWFHVAYTYDKAANGGAGEFAMYFNGEKIRSGPPNGLTSGEPTGAIDLGVWDDRGLGDFYDGLGIGSVPDGAGARRLHGLMDEFYIFSRALSEAEIRTLALLAPPAPADFDEDGDVDAEDLAQWKGDFGVNALSDADNDGDSDGADFIQWQQQLGSTSAAAATGAVPEPSTWAMLCLAAVAGKLAKRRRIAQQVSTQ